MTLKYKFLLIIITPFLFLSYFVLNTIQSKLEYKNQLNKLNSTYNKSIIINNLIHEIQIERGLSLSYIASKKKYFAENIKKQRVIVDEKLNTLKNIITKDSFYEKELSPIIGKIETINIIRKDIDLKRIEAKSILNYFNDINLDLLEYINYIFVLQDNGSYLKLSNTYINLLKAKEFAGIERALLSNIFATGKIFPDTYKQISFLIASENTYLTIVKKLMNKNQLEFLEKRMDNDTIIKVENFRNISFNKVEKNQILSNIKKTIGYDGLIHNYKNYLLRGDEKYYKTFQIQFEQLNNLIKQYKNLSTSNKEENELINSIYTTFKKYHINLEVIVKLQKNTNIQEIDKLVKIDDTLSVRAINTLENRIIGANEYDWFEVATKKINILHDIEVFISKDILNKINNELEELSKEILYNSILIISILLFIIILSFKIMNNILNSIEDIQNTLTSFFDYVKDKNKNVEPIIIKSKDELATISKTININIENTKRYLDNKLEKQVKKEKEILRTLSKYVIYSKTDLNGIITEASDAFCKLSGYEREELIGKSHNIIKHPETPKNIHKDIWKNILTGKQWIGEIKNLKKDGGYYWVYAEIYPFYDENKNIISYISLRQDITAKKDLEKQQLRIVEQAKMASLGEMIGNIAHQWRQPLSKISTISSGMKLEYDLDLLDKNKIDMYTKEIVDTTQYLSEIIETFTNFINDEKIYEKVHIQNEIKKALYITSSVLTSYHIKINDNINYDEPVHTMMISGELPEVIINILNNAKDMFLEKDIENPWVELNLKKGNGKILITIEDNGGGIPLDIKSKIFEAYFTTKHKSQGTGLGLNISYRIITESLKGNIYVKNSKNGAKFFIELPLS